jgi:hypothetical protein
METAGNFNHGWTRRNAEVQARMPEPGRGDCPTKARAALNQTVRSEKARQATKHSRHQVAARDSAMNLPVDARFRLASVRGCFLGLQVLLELFYLRGDD